MQPSQTTIKAVSRVLEDLDKRSRKKQYLEDPILWGKDVAGVDVWFNPENPERSQAEILRSVAKNKDTAVKAAHGTSKSFTAAFLICWWIDTRYPNCFVASTAPSNAQIGAIVWREVRRMFNHIEKRYNEGEIDHKLPGYITTQNEWKDDDGMMLGFGRKPPDQKTDDAFQGLHDKGGVLAIGDESVGLTEEMIDALGNITSNAASRRLLICNPTNPASYVGKLFKEKPKNWNLITISVFDNPNFTGEEVPEDVKSGLSDESYVTSKREEYGEGTPRWVSRVEGEFAFDVENSLITERELSVAYDTEIYPDSDTLPVLGVDVARFGADSSVIYLNHDGHLRLHESWNKAPATETAAKIHRAALDTGAWQVRIDGAGMGGPIIDQVVGLAEGRYAVISMVGNAASPNKRQWINARAWWYDSLRQALYEGHIDIDPMDEKLIDELMSIQLKFAPSGGLQIESKDDMRKRGVKSPDFADAVVYACANLEQWIANPLKPGDTIYYDHDEFLEPDERLWDTF